MGPDSRTGPDGGESCELAVVIVSYGARELLRACLVSLEQQRDVEMVVHVVDNASPDGSARMVRDDFPWVRLTALDENLGFARANNLVLRATGEPSVLVLNPDTRLPAGSLRACLDQLARERHTGVLSPRLVDDRGRPDPRCRRGFPTVWSALCTLARVDGLLGRRAGDYPARWLDPEAAGDVVAVSGAFMLMRRAALEEVGLFDERYFMYGEDLDLCLRMREAGWAVRYWPGAEVVHIGGGSTGTGLAPAAARDAWFRSMGPFLRRRRGPLRGRVSGTVAGALAEIGRAGDRLARRRPRA